MSHYRLVSRSAKPGFIHSLLGGTSFFGNLLPKWSSCFLFMSSVFRQIVLAIRFLDGDSKSPGFVGDFITTEVLSDRRSGISGERFVSVGFGDVLHLSRVLGV